MHTRLAISLLFSVECSKLLRHMPPAIVAATSRGTYVDIMCSMYSSCSKRRCCDELAAMLRMSQLGDVILKDEACQPCRSDLNVNSSCSRNLRIYIYICTCIYIHACTKLHSFPFTCPFEIP